MKRVRAIAFVLPIVLLTLFVPEKASGQEETSKKDRNVFRVSFQRLNWNFDGNQVILPSIGIQFEHYLWDRAGIGFQVRKESQLDYEGYYVGPYGTFRSLGEVYFLANGGVELGVSSVKYYSLEVKDQGGYFWQRWVFIAQPSYKGVGFYPFGTLGMGFSKKHVIVEGGVRIQLMRTGVQEALFGPSQENTSYSIRNSIYLELVPSAVLQAGISF